MIRRVQQNARAATRHKVELPDTYTTLKAHVDPGVDLGTGIKGMMPRTFIHFSDIEKLGIYPKSTYNTPIGIYAYPLTDIILRKFQMGALPFAQDRALVILFDVKDTRGTAYSSHDIPERKYEWLKRRIIEDSRFQDRTWRQPPTVLIVRVSNIKNDYLRNFLTLGMQQHYYGSLVKGQLHIPTEAFRSYFAKGIAALSSDHIEGAAAQLEDDITDALRRRGFSCAIRPTTYTMPHYRRRWWDEIKEGALYDKILKVIEATLDELDIQAEPSLKPWEQDAYVSEINFGKLWNITRNLVGGNPRKWAQLLREFEIDGVVDDAGYGLIHEHEPIQAVFFGATILKIIDILPNEYTPSKVRRRVARAVDE